jgi:hypothetical protein
MIFHSEEVLAIRGPLVCRVRSSTGPTFGARPSPYPSGPDLRSALPRATQPHQISARRFGSPDCWDGLGPTPSVGTVWGDGLGSHLRSLLPCGPLVALGVVACGVTTSFPAHHSHAWHSHAWHVGSHLRFSLPTGGRTWGHTFVLCCRARSPRRTWSHVAWSHVAHAHAWRTWGHTFASRFPLIVLHTVATCIHDLPFRGGSGYPRTTRL